DTELPRLDHRLAQIRIVGVHLVAKSGVDVEGGSVRQGLLLPDRTQIAVLELQAAGLKEPGTGRAIAARGRQKAIVGQTRVGGNLIGKQVQSFAVVSNGVTSAQHRLPVAPEQRLRQATLEVRCPGQTERRREILLVAVVESLALVVGERR